MQRVLVFFPTYNEAANIGQLVGAIREQVPQANILVVDDASEDGTGRLLNDLAATDGRLRAIHRPRKLGVGSAHKIAMLHSRAERYDVLITMDADFSHNPRYLPQILSHLQEHDFVIGSRYVRGGRCDYGLRRRILSRVANFTARVMAGLKLAENTTLFRGFRLSLLDRMDVERIKSDGYSFAIESLYEVARVSERLMEFPIHFEDRLHGDSKISKKEIYAAVGTIARLGVRRLLQATPARADPGRGAASCKMCGNNYTVELYPPRGEARTDAAAYSVSSHTARSHGRILQCLRCGVTFMEPKLGADALVAAYAAVEDPAYLAHIHAREHTFEYNLARVIHHVAPGDRVLDVGSYCGVFLRVAERRGIDISGIEPSGWAVRAARQLTNRPVYQGTLKDVPPQAAPFDVVTAWDVLEHLYDPEAELHAINQLLRPGGRLMLSTLMIDNWFPRLTGRHWPWLMDMHLYYFTEGNLVDLLHRAGFVIVESRKYCHIITLAYLCSKLASLGVPLAASLERELERGPLGRVLIPFRFGDIKLVVCKKVATVEPLNPAPDRNPVLGRDGQTLPRLADHTW